MKKHVKTIVRTALLSVAALIVGLNVYTMNASRLAGDLVPMPLGVGATVVLSGSMEPTLSTGDLLIIAEQESYGVDDVVVFQSNRIAVVHRIIEIKEETVEGEDGEDENGVFPEYDDEPERYNARYEEGKTTTVDAPTPQLTKGYRYDRYETNNDKNALTLKLPTAGKDGLIIKMYYYRKEVNYSVKYVEENGLPISFDKVVTGTGKYLDELKIGDIVKDIKIPGYELINGNDIVKLEDDNQIIYCKYRKQSASYYYKAFSGSGRFGGNDEINVRFGDQPEGNQAVPDAGWILEGWYYGDRFGNDLQAVSSVGATVVDGKVIPKVVSEEDVGKEFFFWAIFIPTTLTITNSVDAGKNTPDWVIPGQGFIYKIEGKPGTATEGISLTVAVPVDEKLTILGLPLGEYNIKLEGDWSWRYVQREQDTAFTMEANGTDLKYSYAAPSPDVGQDGYYITDGAYNDPTPKAEP